MTTHAPPMPRRRATSTVRLTREMYERLWRMREPAETMDQVVRRLITVYELQDDQPTEQDG